MEQQSLAAILHNRHFNRFAAILSAAMSFKWIQAHPEAPSVRGTVERLAKLNRSLSKDATSIKYDFVKEWSTLFVNIVQTDPRLCYSDEDYRWFVETLDGDDARLVFSMLFAIAWTQQRWFAAEQVSTLTGMKPSTIRNKAASGDFLAAKKVGNTWIIPELSLRAADIDVPSELKIEVEHESEE